MTGNPFEAERDPELGALLRNHLEPEDTAGFTARVVARLPRRPQNFWEELAGWARPGIAAGLLLAAALGYVVATRTAPDPDVVASDVLDTADPLDGTALRAVVLGSAR